MLLTWRSTVRSLIVRAVGDRPVRHARRKQSEDLDLARRSGRPATVGGTPRLPAGRAGRGRAPRRAPRRPAGRRRTRAPPRRRRPGLGRPGRSRPGPARHRTARRAPPSARRPAQGVEAPCAHRLRPDGPRLRRAPRAPEQRGARSVGQSRRVGRSLTRAVPRHRRRAISTNGASSRARARSSAVSSSARRIEASRPQRRRPAPAGGAQDRDRAAVPTAGLAIADLGVGELPAQAVELGRAVDAPRRRPVRSAVATAMPARAWPRDRRPATAPWNSMSSAGRQGSGRGTGRGPAANRPGAERGRPLLRPAEVEDLAGTPRSTAQ